MGLKETKLPTDAEFVENPHRCPRCKSEDIGGPRNLQEGFGEKNQASDKVYCYACGSSWFRNFVLQGYRMVKTMRPLTSEEHRMRIESAKRMFHTIDGVVTSHDLTPYYDLATVAGRLHRLLHLITRDDFIMDSPELLTAVLWMSMTSPVSHEVFTEVAEFLADDYLTGPGSRDFALSKAKAMQTKLQTARAELNLMDLDFYGVERNYNLVMCVDNLLTAYKDFIQSLIENSI